MSVRQRKNGADTESDCTRRMGMTEMRRISKGFKIALVVIAVISVPLVLLTVFRPYALYSGFSSIRSETFICRSCAARQRKATYRRLGTPYRRTNEIEPTFLSELIGAEIGECKHEWHLCRHWSLHWDGSHGEGTTRVPHNLTDEYEYVNGIRLFSESTQRSPKEVWQTLFDYYTTPLDDSKVNHLALSLRKVPYGKWLRQNYPIMVEEVKEAKKNEQLQ